MSNQVKLSARPRPEAGRNAVGKVRARGAIPAVMYGAKDAATNLEVSEKRHRKPALAQPSVRTSWSSSKSRTEKRPPAGSR